MVRNGRSSAGITISGTVFVIQDPIDLIMISEKGIGAKLFLDEKQYNEEASEPQRETTYFNDGVEAAANNISPCEEKLQREHGRLYEPPRVVMRIDGPNAGFPCQIACSFPVSSFPSLAFFTHPDVYARIC